MIQIDKLAFAYKRSHKLFSSLSLDLPQGTIVGLLGRNGEGKSTLLKLLTGQLLYKEGFISVNGNNPARREVSFLNKIFLLPEEISCPSISIREYFDIIVPLYPNYSAQIAEEIIQEFDLKWDMNLGKVSQGQKKKAVIALALALRTPVLLLDEPTNGLDIPSKSAFRRIVARYTTEEQTLIISTHQVRDLEHLIDRIVLLDNNKIICNESIYDLCQRFAFLPVKDGDLEKLIYQEKSLVGDIGIFEGDSSLDIDNFSMELFFNGMISEQEKMLNLLKQTNK